MHPPTPGGPPSNPVFPTQSVFPMTTHQSTSRKGFTLIELLTVITIIGILAAILIPTISGVIDVARRQATSSNAHQIAQTYIGYSTGSSNPRTIQTTGMAKGGTAVNGVAANIEDVAFILAKTQGFIDAAMWFIRTDENLNGMTIPRSVIVGDATVATSADPAFVSIRPKAWAFVVGLSTNAQASTTPLLWTYGLGHNGVWAPGAGSPWKGRGGHVAYLDGHVEWAEKISTDAGGVSFVTYSGANMGKPAVDYLDAINS